MKRDLLSNLQTVDLQRPWHVFIMIVEGMIAVSVCFINIDQKFDTDKTVSIFNMTYKAVMKTVN